MALSRRTESVDSQSIWSTLTEVCCSVELLCTAAWEQPSVEVALQEERTSLQYELFKFAPST